MSASGTISASILVNSSISAYQDPRGTISSTITVLGDIQAATGPNGIIDVLIPVDVTISGKNYDPRGTINAPIVVNSHMFTPDQNTRIVSQNVNVVTAPFLNTDTVVSKAVTYVVVIGDVLDDEYYGAMIF